MNQNQFTIDNKTGLGSFQGLTSFGVKNFVTIDNDIWGNMNQFLATSDEERAQIDIKDRKLSDFLQTKTAFAMSTPPEDTILHIDKASCTLLKHDTKADEGGYRYIIARANTIIYEKQKEVVELVAAPADCAVMIYVNPDWNGLLFMHFGSPQLFQGLHIKSFHYLRALHPELNLSNGSLYITPHICSSHYSISSEKFEDFYKEFRRMDLFEKFSEMRTETNTLTEGDSSAFTNRYYLDFIKLANYELEEMFGITKVVDANMCTYEASEEGKSLYSYTRYKEMKETAEAKKYNGSFNVMVSI